MLRRRWFLVQVECEDGQDEKVRALLKAAMKYIGLDAGVIRQFGKPDKRMRAALQEDKDG